jgi:calcineurin-like phosphoesterase family protein
MNEAMIERWNRVVSPKDTVYHLGDFVFGNPVPIRERLNGRIILIRGNHDNLSKTKESEFFEAVYDIYVLKPEDGHRIVLCHYPLRSWRYMSYGAGHLHGHSHGTLEPLGASLDVGVMNWDYTPVPLEKVQEKLNELRSGQLEDHFERLPVFKEDKDVPMGIILDTQKAFDAYNNGEDF